MFDQLLKERTLPALMTDHQGRPVDTFDRWRARRREIIDLLSREEYGFTPTSPDRVDGEILSSENAYAGKALQQRVSVSFDTPSGRFSFPFTLILPKNDEPLPVFVTIAFRRETPDRYLPAEEIVDRGYAIATFCYLDVTADGPEMDGLAAMYPRDGEASWGKIGMWAFAASRVLDYLQTLPEIDPARACVTGHSRLGKTALWCGAQDERFSMVISNDSGCSGAAITRLKAGERVKAITTNFPFWFCDEYRSWADRESEMPFEQHMLLALIAPRKLYVCSAVEDEWADPASEFLACAAASEAWTVQRVPGLIADDLPAVDRPLHEGGICYHVRSGGHFHSRTDWTWQMDCRDRYHV